MKDRITINGVELTRQQVEAARAALNTPDPIPNLTRVCRRSDRTVTGIVLKGPIQRCYAENYKGSYPTSTVVVVEPCGGGNSYNDDADLLRLWKVVDGSVVA